MRWDDIPGLLQIAEQSSSCWLRADFRAIFQSSETLGFVAEVAGRLVGFALCNVERIAAEGGRHRIAWWRRWKALLGGSPAGTARRVRLFAVAAAVEVADTGVELALLEKFQRSSCSPTDQLEAMVPETDAAAQQFLREAGFVAIRVVPGYYCHIDGYLMAHDHRDQFAPDDCQAEPSPITMRRRGLRPR
jgi:ribosomal protein S18 acetylase RimI-like enzyme